MGGVSINMSGRKSAPGSDAKKGGGYKWSKNVIFLRVFAEELDIEWIGAFLPVSPNSLTGPPDFDHFFCCFCFVF